MNRFFFVLIQITIHRRNSCKKNSYFQIKKKKKNNIYIYKLLKNFKIVKLILTFHFMKKKT